MHAKFSLRPQSKTRLPQKKGSRFVEALVELGQGGAVVHQPESQVSLRCRQVDSRTGKMLPEEISYFEEMRLGLMNTQRCLRKLERHE
jgi:hypothetical protein